MKYNLTEPYLIRGGAIEMGAIKKWANTSYLKKEFKNPIVSVETYQSEKHMQVSKASSVDVSFSDYLNNTNDKQYLSDVSLNAMGASEQIYKDICNPALSGPFKETPVENFLFIGNNTKTGAHLHVSPYDFVLHQIVGKKIVHLLDFEELTLNSMFSRRYNFSKENFYDLDKSRYKTQAIELEPGDVLYLPPWIWHAVENVGYSIAVTKIFKRDNKYLKLKRFKQLKRRDKLKSLMNKLMFN